MIKVVSGYFKKAVFLAAFLFFSSFAFAKETPIENLFSYELKNGMELFVAENHTVPLVYIEIAVRGGGIGQTEENAGLFHLYEHMMFKGNSKYQNNEEMQSALTRMGVSNWNGTTTDEYVNYFFTVPSAKLKEGLEFWNYAIRNPKMDEREFEAEKKVVLSEIEGDKGNPGDVLYKFISEKMFPDEPWVTSPGGNAEVIENATIAQLREIQKNYYIPNNTALFVGGDVKPEEVYKLVNKIYGNWKKGTDPWISNNRKYTKEPLAAPEFYVMPVEQLAPEMAEIDVIYRGPDAEYDRDDTYAADTLLLACRDPQSFFNTTLTGNANFAIPDSTYCGVSYPTARRLGKFTVYAIMLAPEQYLPERVIEFVKEVPAALTGVLPEDSPLTDYTIYSIQRRLYNDSIYEQETPQSLLTTARFWWCKADTDYYFNYTENLNKTTASDITAFLNKYIIGKNPVVVVLVNPAVYEACKASYEENNFGVIK